MGKNKSIKNSDFKIWVDVSHPAQLNFYLNAIKILSENNKVFLTVLDRGRLYDIAKKELSSKEIACEIIPIGKHRGNKISAILDANLIRLIKLYFYYFRYKPNLSIGNGFLHGVVARTFRFPSVMFNDDLERGINVWLMKELSSRLYHVSNHDSINDDPKITDFKGLKEWSYLSTKYFRPDESILDRYGLEQNKYIFVREVSSGTINYSGQNQNIIASVAHQFPKGLKVILSLEDKKTIDKYPADWILLKEPVGDIHSLIYYSKILLSSGDSMAREGSILGVPSIYCGIRKMKANEIMEERGMLFKSSAEEVPSLIEDICDMDFGSKEIFRSKLEEDWEDVTELVLKIVNQYKNI